MLGSKKEKDKKAQSSKAGSGAVMGCGHRAAPQLWLTPVLGHEQELASNYRAASLRANGSVTAGNN